MVISECANKHIISAVSTLLYTYPTNCEVFAINFHIKSLSRTSFKPPPIITIALPKLSLYVSFGNFCNDQKHITKTALQTSPRIPVAASAHESPPRCNYNQPLCYCSKTDQFSLFLCFHEQLLVLKLHLEEQKSTLCVQLSLRGELSSKAARLAWNCIEYFFCSSLSFSISSRNVGLSFVSLQCWRNKKKKTNTF